MVDAPTNPEMMFEPLPAGEEAEAVSTLPGEAEQPDKQPIVPVPDDAPPMQFQHPQHGEPSMAWPYHGADGQLVGYVCRWNYTNAENKQDKDILPVTYCDLGNGHRQWHSPGYATPRPLFRMGDILASPDAAVLVTVFTVAG